MITSLYWVVGWMTSESPYQSSKNLCYLIAINMPKKLIHNRTILLNELPRSRATRYQRGLKSQFLLEGDTSFPLPN
jgi:hypothetical protein